MYSYLTHRVSVAVAKVLLALYSGPSSTHHALLIAEPPTLAGFWLIHISLI